jgi:heat shock protein beta
VLFSNIFVRHKHSAFSSTFPIYLFERWTEEVPDESQVVSEPEAKSEKEIDPSPPPASEIDDDEAIIEEVPKEAKNESELPPPKMVNVTKEQWSRLNSQPPLWVR